MLIYVDMLMSSLYLLSILKLLLPSSLQAAKVCSSWPLLFTCCSSAPGHPPGRPGMGMRRHKFLPTNIGDIQYMDNHGYTDGKSMFDSGRIMVKDDFHDDYCN